MQLSGLMYYVCSENTLLHESFWLVIAVLNSNCVLILNIVQYLKYRGLEKSVNAFESECSEKGTPIASTEVTPKASQRLSAVQVCLASLLALIAALAYGTVVTSTVPP